MKATLLGLKYFIKEGKTLNFYFGLTVKIQVLQWFAPHFTE